MPGPPFKAKLIGSAYKIKAIELPIIHILSERLEKAGLDATVPNTRKPI